MLMLAPVKVRSIHDFWDQMTTVHGFKAPILSGETCSCKAVPNCRWHFMRSAESLEHRYVSPGPTT
jgi:hypothetical protein